MSKSYRQSITLLSVIGGCLARMDEDKMFSALFMRDHVTKTYKHVLQVLDKWPKSGDHDKNAEEVIKWVDEWDAVYLQGLGELNKAVVLACVADRCLSDLLETVNNRYKKSMLNTLEEPIRVIHDYMDPNGVNFPAYEKAGEGIDKLHTIIGWDYN